MVGLEGRAPRISLTTRVRYKIPSIQGVDEKASVQEGPDVEVAFVEVKLM